MSQLAVDSTVLPPYWNGKSTTGEPELVVAIATGADGGSLTDLTCIEPRSLRRFATSRAWRRRTISACPPWKRLIDIVGSAALLVLLSPFLFAIGLYIKCVSRGSVLFRQQRFGRGGRPFQVWKFRTIEISDASARHRSHVADLIANDRPLEKCDDRLEVISGGGLLRRLGIDELPQLINVLKGEMSLVGPRPDVVPPGDYSEWQRRRFDVLPGITGLWQVSGKNRTTFTTMMQLDALYVRRRSIRLDLWILLWTIPAILLE